MNPRMNLNKSRMSRENENPQEPGSHRPIFQKNLSLIEGVILDPAFSILLN